jgi:hypothetical protein
MYMVSIEVQIQERINLANNILTKLNSYVEPSRVRSSSRVLSVDFTAHSASPQVKAILLELSQWQFVTKELLINAFGETSRYTKLFQDSIVEHKIGFNYKDAGSAERVPAVAGNRIPPWRAIGYRVRTAC